MGKLNFATEPKSQIDTIRDLLNKKQTITSKEAFERYGITRLSAIIFDLRAEGMDIKSENGVCKNRYGNVCRYAIYSLKVKETKKTTKKTETKTATAKAEKTKAVKQTGKTATKTVKKTETPKKAVKKADTKATKTVGKKKTSKK